MARLKKEGPSPFDYVKMILNGASQTEMSSSYAPYIVNRAVAHHRDAIFICQLLNEYQVTPEEHYTYLFNRVPKYNRSFQKWVSSKKGNEDTADLELIAKYYECSLDVAREYLLLHTQKDLEAIRSAYGGKD